MVEAVEEEDIPPEYDLQYDESTAMCTREATQFSAHRNGELVSICDLDKMDLENKDNTRIMLRGYVTYGTKKLYVEVGPLVEWCIEYGPYPHLWTHTSKAWYKLTSPSKEYQKTHEVARRRFELCSRLFILAVTIMPEECTYNNFVQVLAGPYQSMKGYSEKEIITERNFILDQADSLEDPSLRNSEFAKTLRSKGSAANKEKKKEKSGSKKEKRDKDRKEKKQQKKSAEGTAWTPRTDDSKVEAALLRRFPRLVSNLMKDKLAWPFLQPVDPIAHGCPQYFDWIKEPMDLGTIKTRLSIGSHYKSVPAAMRDVRLVWSNCRSYNEPSELTQMATTLENKFEDVVAREETDLIKEYGAGVRKDPDSRVVHPVDESESAPAGKAQKRPREPDIPSQPTSPKDSSLLDAMSEFGLSAAERVKRGRAASKFMSYEPRDGGASHDLDLDDEPMEEPPTPRTPKPTKATKAPKAATHTNKVSSEPKVRKAPAEPAVQERKTTESTQPKRKIEPTSGASTAGHASAPQRKCIARGCSNPSRPSSKYCSSTCAEKVAAARVEVMAQFMSEGEVEDLLIGKAVKVRHSIFVAGIKIS